VTRLPAFVAFLATTAEFFAFAQIAAPQHMRAVRGLGRPAGEIAMTFLKRLLAVFAAVSMSGAVLSLAIV